MQGLGKTAQSIAVLEYQRQLGGAAGPFLVVAPLTTLGHWQREIETWTPMVRPFALRPLQLPLRHSASPPLEQGSWLLLDRGFRMHSQGLFFSGSLKALKRES